MKKTLAIACLVVVVFITTGCQSRRDGVTFDDADTVVMAMTGETLTILQLTDMHLTFGIDHNDRSTYQAIETLVMADDYDLVVFTGDMVMSPLAPWLFARLVMVMERLKTPWTFIFGNHDGDYHSLATLIAQTESTEYLMFLPGPLLEEGGVGNFKITFTHENTPFYHLYFLDTKSERDEHTEAEGKYDYLSPAQVAWYAAHVENDTVPSIVFMHTPLRQYLLVSEHPYEGNFNEPVHPQGKDTGFFDAMVSHGKSVGVFVGHDHENDFQFILDGLLLAYGRVSGYNAYGPKNIGGRVITIDANAVMSTHIVLLREVSP